MATIIGYWFMGSIFIVDVPFWVRRKVTKLTKDKKIMKKVTDQEIHAGEIAKLKKIKERLNLIKERCNVGNWNNRHRWDEDGKKEMFSHSGKSYWKIIKDRDEYLTEEDLKKVGEKYRKERYGKNIYERPIEKTTVAAARTFLKAFPSDMALPEIDPSPDGEITISWNKGFRYMLTFSIGKTSTLTYIWINGKEFGQGELDFQKGDTIDTIGASKIGDIKLDRFRELPTPPLNWANVLKCICFTLLMTAVAFFLNGPFAAAVGGPVLGFIVYLKVFWNKNEFDRTSNSTTRWEENDVLVNDGGG
jgi:hypothetical protein